MKRKIPQFELPLDDSFRLAGERGADPDFARQSDEVRQERERERKQFEEKHQLEIV